MVTFRSLDHNSIIYKGTLTSEFRIFGGDSSTRGERGNYCIWAYLTPGHGELLDPSPPIIHEVKNVWIIKFELPLQGLFDTWIIMQGLALVWWDHVEVKRITQLRDRLVCTKLPTRYACLIQLFVLIKHLHLSDVFSCYILEQTSNNTTYI